MDHLMQCIELIPLFMIEKDGYTCVREIGRKLHFCWKVVGPSVNAKIGGISMKGSYMSKSSMIEPMCGISVGGASLVIKILDWGGTVVRDVKCETRVAELSL